jgi:hypothetical protein
MAVLARNNWTSAQRVDLPDMQSIDSYVSSDFRAFVKMMCGTSSSYIFTGMTVTGASGRDVTISIADAAFYLPSDASGCMYIVGPDEDDAVLSLPANSTVYVEAVFARSTGTSVTRATFDETAVTDAHPDGQEYSASVDAQNIMEMEVSYNTVGFTSGSVPIAKFVTTATISSYTDCRNMFFRLGTGGSTPNSTHQYGWSVNRAAAPTTGTVFGTNTNGSPFQMTDSGGVMNDSAFTCFKDFHDALLTVIAEIRGVSIWYTSSAVAAYIASISLNQLMFDSPGGYHMVADDATYITWSRSSDGLLRGEGTGPLQFKANYGFVEWELGGSFDATDRNYSGVGDPLFAKAVASGSNIYLGLIRDTVVGAGNPIEWIPATHSSLYAANQCVKGSAGDFTGIAVGDYIRKDSEGMAKYYKVSAVWDGASHAGDGYIALAAATELEVDRVIDAASSEPLKYFRERYDNSSLVVDDATSRAAGTYNSADYFWLGCRDGSNFFMREHGMMRPGESRIAGDDSEAPRNAEVNPINIQFTSDVRYKSDVLCYVDATGAYVNLPVVALIYIYKRPNARQSVLTNTVFNVSSINDGSLTLDADGKTLWVKLSSEDGGGHTLSSGDVEDTTVTDAYKVLATGAAPLNIYDNKDVYPLCTRRTFGGVAYLDFFDGSVLGPNGLVSKASVEHLDSIRFGAAQTHHVEKTAATPYSVDYRYDHHVSVTVGGVHSVVLPSAVLGDIREGTTYWVSDVAGTCVDATSCINVTATGGVLIDGAATYVIDSPFACVGFCLVNGAWKVL